MPIIVVVIIIIIIFYVEIRRETDIIQHRKPENPKTITLAAYNN